MMNAVLRYARGRVVALPRRGSNLASSRCMSNAGKDGRDKMYMHVSPSGDWWTGSAIFAAKHLQPDYVKSVPLPDGFDPNAYFGGEDEDGEEESDMQQPKLKLNWEEKQNLLHQIYDEGKLPSELLGEEDGDIKSP
ncbi:hypothetical protein ACHAXT_012069 [Thalassiosira profunda]